MTQLFGDLEDAIKTGFLNKSISSNERLQPRLLLNDPSRGEKVLGSILNALEQCDSFWFSVAFVTSSGIACIHNKLRQLEKRKVKGKILVSQYLNFTNPEALRALGRFSNIEARFIQDADFHGKGYIFRKDNQFDFVIGSSNLTADALCANSELNIKVTSLEHSKMTQDSLDTFEKFFQMSVPLTDDVIDSYEDIFNRHPTRYAEIYSSRRQLIHPDDGKDFEPNSMQREALNNLQKLRESGVDKALVISATGTGKTVLSAFDVKAQKAKRMLFVVHRETIARKSMDTFKRIFGEDKTYGLYSGGQRSADADFLFCTVQTINKDRHLHNFASDEFDYIIIDETHRAGARTYKKVLNYFEPSFLLGMTATPERTDGFDIFSLFDHNVGYEIRLQRAMQEGLLSPFHYFGVTDITVDGDELDDKSDFGLLVAEERVDRIIEVAQQYGCDNGMVKGLIFCSRVEESEELSRLFNLRGFSTLSLSGKNSEDERLEAIERLEKDQGDDRLDYIFSVDVFNEGVDIPKVNQIIMLRPTQSAIIFVHQLGRGLRNIEQKEYLTVIDFIGNYQNNYMIPIALYGDSSFNKDTLRKLITSGSSLIPGASTVNFSEISQQKIFDSINTSNLNRKKDLQRDYSLLKTRIGKVPMMMDFLESDSRDPYSFVEYSKSYLDFVNIVEDEIHYDVPPTVAKLLQYLSRDVNDGKRIEESLLLSLLIDRRSFQIEEYYETLSDEFKIDIKKIDWDSVVRNLNLEFITERSQGKALSVGDLHDYQIVKVVGNTVSIGNSLANSLTHETFKEFLVDSVEYSVGTFRRYFNPEDYIDGFQRYQKYSRKDVFRILGWEKNPNPLNVGGYVLSNDLSSCPIFVNYQKLDDIADSIKYEDRFVSPDRFIYMSKNRRTLSSPDVAAMGNQENNGIRLPLFVKKNNDEGQNFYFLGDLLVISDRFIQETMKVADGSDVSVVKMEFMLDKSVEPGLYEYITEMR
tara:strand:- start:283 stop:3219 length:2937 start_codon:yes stop_codon:yes gene_type:complete